MNGKSTARPLDFLVIGAQKAGTTSLFEYLRTHPELHLPPGKEEQFFSVEGVYRRGWDAYVNRVFYRAPDDALWGTATPQYMSGGVWSDDGTPIYCEGVLPESLVPQRIRALMPECRLIAILRDPVERCRSHYQNLVLQGVERRPFELVIGELLTTEHVREARRHPRETNGCVVRGEYARILAPYYDEFGPDRIYVLFSDQLAKAPVEVMSTTFAFLGVDAQFVPPNSRGRYREGSDRTRMPFDLSGLQRELGRNPWARRVWEALPSSARHRGQDAAARVTYRFNLWNRIGDAPRPPVGGAVQVALRAHYDGERAELANLLGRELPW